MAKGKERVPIEYYESLFKVGLPEVDKVIEGHGHDHLAPDNRIETKLPKNNTGEDRISRLPEDILQFIISLLTMREGAATGILSRRWRNLWSTSVSPLDLNDSNLLGYEHGTDIFYETKFKKERRSHRRICISRIPQCRRARRKGLLECERTKFVRRVNRILELRLASTIDKFKVSFPVGKESASHVDTWMKVAAAQGVKKLELDLNWSDYSMDCDPFNRYNFPVQVFGSSLKYLRLRFCLFDFPPRFQGLNSLVSLNLRDTILTGNHVESIISNCRSLEWLSLRCCQFIPHAILKFVVPSIPLKHLDIWGCYNIMGFELRDVNLLSLELNFLGHETPHWETKISIKNVPHLARLMLYTDSPVEILGNVSNLETLFVKRQWHKMPILSAFSNLKRLVFAPNMYVSNLFEVVCLLETCPMLQLLEINMGSLSENGDKLSTYEEAKISTMPEFPHNNLNEVVIYGFDRYPCLIDFAKYLLRNAIVLEKMTIHTTCKMYIRSGIWRLSENGKPVWKAVKRVCKLLRKEARPSTELLIVSHDETISFPHL